MLAVSPFAKPYSSAIGGLAGRLRIEATGEACFDRLNRQRYATAASFNRIAPQRVVVLRTTHDTPSPLSIEHLLDVRSRTGPDARRCTPRACWR
jgi:hypothetical protein